MEMDVQTGLVCVGFVILAGAVLLVISMLGIKEKTYEEAIAEQRKMPDDALLLRRPVKTKSKDKKPQRTGKKVKEKKKEVVKQQSSTDTDEPVVLEQEPVHVKIIPEPEVMGEGKPDHQKKNKKKEKVKPILVHREPKDVADVGAGDAQTEPAKAANHFELIQPRDDLSLKQRRDSRSETPTSDGPLFSGDASGGDAAPKLSSVKESPEKAKKVVKAEAKSPVKAAKSEPIEMVRAEDSVSSGSTPVDSSPIQQNKATKEKKKAKKQDLGSSLLNPVNLQQLSALILKAELSPNERQILTNLLLNDTQDERIDHSEWSEGTQMAKLKKQLADKEEALANEISASQAIQSKLKELRTELNEERSKCRQYEEGVLSKHSEVQAMQARMQLQNRERQALMQELQQLQGKVKEDALLIRSLQESGQAQVALQQEVHSLRQQMQQMEVHLTRLSESENSLKGQLHSASASCSAELQKSRRLEDELRDALGNLEALKDNVSTRQEMARQMEELDRAKKEMEKTLGATVQSQEELGFDKQRLSSEVHELTTKLADARKDAEYEKARLQAEIHALTNKVSELQASADKNKMAAEQLKAEADKQKAAAETLRVDADKQKATIEQIKVDADKQKSAAEQFRADVEKQKVAAEKIKADADRQKAEKDKMAAERDKLAADASRLLEENKNLHNERDRLQSELTAAMAGQRMAGDGRENGGKDLNTDFIRHENESKEKDMVVEKLQQELAEKEKLLHQLNSETRAAVTRLETVLQANQQAFQLAKTELLTMQTELEAQKTKNNDLRQKNWKAMEALSTTEKALESNISETDKLVNEAVAQVRAEVQEECTAVLSRLLPDVSVDKKNLKGYLTKLEEVMMSLKAASETSNQSAEQAKQVTELQKQVAELQGVVTLYKKIIEDAKDNLYTEKDMKANEEKVAELEAVVARYKTVIEDTEGMLKKLQNHIEAEELRWGELLEARQADIDSLQSQIQEKEKALEELKRDIGPLRERAEADAEKLMAACNEKDSLESKLSAEQERLKELNKELVKLRSNLKIGQDSYEAEHKIRLELEEQIKAASCRGNATTGEAASNLNNAAPAAVPIELRPDSVPQTENSKRKNRKAKQKNGADGN